MAQLLAVYLLIHSEPLIIFSVLEKAFFFAFLTQIQLPVLSSSTGLAQIHSLSDVIKIGKQNLEIKKNKIYVLFPQKDQLIFGSSEGNYAIWIEGSLLRGTSKPTKTFNNPTLTKNKDFKVPILLDKNDLNSISNPDT